MAIPSEIKRVSNWPRHLADFIETRRHVPFAWGSQDCCTFASDAVLAIYGVDPMAEFRGQYATGKEAVKIMGGSDMLLDFANGVMLRAGFAEMPPEFAGQGDPVCVMLRRMTCGIHLGNVVAAPGQNGLVFLPPTEILTAWRIG